MTINIDGDGPRLDVLPAVVEPDVGGDPENGRSIDLAGGRDPRQDAAAPLRTARRERGWSLEELSNRTCIKTQRLAEIEQGQVGSCGAAVYARGHLRAIAAILQIDPHPLIEALVSEEPPTPLVPHRSGRSLRPMAGLTFLALCLLVLLVLGLTLT
ncbi:MAG: helix-turn-helix domain-containing protein [Mycobacteriaceae bacterium]